MLKTLSGCQRWPDTVHLASTAVHNPQPNSAKEANTPHTGQNEQVVLFLTIGNCFGPGQAFPGSIAGS